MLCANGFIMVGTYRGQMYKSPKMLELDIELVTIPPFNMVGTYNYGEVFCDIMCFTTATSQWWKRGYLVNSFSQLW